jgi:isoleucyl-tRNA synthetase
VLERYMLHLLADMDAKLKQAVEDFDFNTYIRLLSDFANEDLSAFFFDIRKDCLYCDAETSLKRRSYRTVLDILFHAMVRYAAPVLVFTSEEVWATRNPDAESVHLLDWPEVDAKWFTRELVERWFRLRELRREVTEAIEPLRREKIVGSSLEAEVQISDLGAILGDYQDDVEFLAELCITSSTKPVIGVNEPIVTKTTHHKCGRCWRHLPEVTEDGALCRRCEDVLNA